MRNCDPCYSAVSASERKFWRVRIGFILARAASGIFVVDSICTNSIPSSVHRGVHLPNTQSSSTKNWVSIWRCRKLKSTVIKPLTPAQRGIYRTAVDSIYLQAVDINWSKVLVTVPEPGRRYQINMRPAWPAIISSRRTSNRLAAGDPGRRFMRKMPAAGHAELVKDGMKIYRDKRARSRVRQV